MGLNNGNPHDLVPAPLPPLDPNTEERASVAVIDLSDPGAPHLLRYVPIARATASTIAPSSAAAIRAPCAQPGRRAPLRHRDQRRSARGARRGDVRHRRRGRSNVFEGGPGPRKLQGLYPNALAVSPDGRRVYVADAGINAVQVIDVDPTARTFTPRRLHSDRLVPQRSGTQRRRHAPLRRQRQGHRRRTERRRRRSTPGSTSHYIAQLLKGSISVIDDVDQLRPASRDGGGGRQQRARAHHVQWVDGAPAAGEVQRGHPVPSSSAAARPIRSSTSSSSSRRTAPTISSSASSPAATAIRAWSLFGADSRPIITRWPREFAIGDNFFDDGEVSDAGPRVDRSGQLQRLHRKDVAAELRPQPAARGARVRTGRLRQGRLSSSRRWNVRASRTACTARPCAAVALRRRHRRRRRRQPCVPDRPRAFHGIPDRRTDLHICQRRHRRRWSSRA